MANGSKINLAGWQKLRAKVKAASAGQARVKVGVLASAGTHPHSSITMAELAAIHEFGSPAAGIPERSFIRKTFELRQANLRQLIQRAAKAFISDRIDLNTALGVMGQWLVTAIRQTITSEEVTPRLEESEAGRRTIARKGSHVTLVDHGQLVGAISYAVVGAEGTSVDGSEEV